MARVDPTRDSRVGVIARALSVGLFVFAGVALAQWILG